MLQSIWTMTKQAYWSNHNPIEWQYNINLLSGSCHDIAQKLVIIGIEVFVGKFGNMPIEIYEKTFVKMGVGYTCLTRVFTSIQVKYQIDCIQMLNKSIIYCNVSGRAISI